MTYLKMSLFAFAVAILSSSAVVAEKVLVKCPNDGSYFSWKETGQGVWEGSIDNPDKVPFIPFVLKSRGGSGISGQRPSLQLSGSNFRVTGDYPYLDCFYEGHIGQNIDVWGTAKAPLDPSKGYINCKLAPTAGFAEALCIKR